MWNVGVTSATGRGRGGSVDRGGRGRTGRGGLYTSYSRAVGFDEPGDGTRIDTQPFPVRPFVFLNLNSIFSIFKKLPINYYIVERMFHRRSVYSFFLFYLLNREEFSVDRHTFFRDCKGYGQF